MVHQKMSDVCDLNNRTLLLQYVEDTPRREGQVDVVGQNKHLGGKGVVS